MVTVNVVLSKELLKWIEARRKTPWGIISRAECVRKIIEIAYQMSKED